MLQLPNNFKTKIINRYGQLGENWLKNINKIIIDYKQQFQLEKIELLKNLSMNILIFATSQQYGNVVLKIGAPSQSSISEINVMKYYSSEYVPKCYYSCLEDRVMLLERIFPGYPLTHQKNMEERIKIFSELSNHLLIKSNDKENFASFEELFKKDLTFSYKNKELFSNISGMIDIANNFYEKIKQMNLPKYILHDDLHHKNILKTKDTWKAIDPHGIIGEKVLETAQFLRSELENTNFKENQFDKMISLLSSYYCEDKILILETLYVYIIKKIISYIKNKYDKNTISYNIDICKNLLKLLSN